MTKESIGADPFALWDAGLKRSTHLPEDDHLQEPAPQEIETTLEEVTPLEGHGETKTESVTVDTEAEVVEEVSEKEPRHDWKKRYNDIRRLDEERLKRITDLEKEIDELKVKKDSSQFHSEEELEALTKDNEELLKVIKSVAHKYLKDEAKTLNKEVTELKSQLSNLNKEKALKELSKIHPDAEEISQSERWKEWLGDQSTAIQGLVYSSHLNDWVRALDIFKREFGLDKTKVSEKKKETQRAAAEAVAPTAVTTPKGDKKVWKESEFAEAISNSTDDEYFSIMKEYKLAAAQNRILYGH